MPNYIVANSLFQPFSYQELIAPIAAATQAHLETQQQYDTLGANASAIGAMLDPEDEEAQKVYKTYMDDLNNQVAALSSKGLDPNTRTGLSKLKTRYSGEIGALQSGLQARQAAIEKYDKMMVDSKGTYIGKDPRQYKTSDFILGKWKLNPDLFGQYFERMVTEGWSQAAIQDALTQMATESKAAQQGEELTNQDAAEIQQDVNSVLGYMRSAMQRIGGQIGIDRLGDSANISRANQAILNGILAGISYKEDYKTLENKGYLDPLESARLEGIRLDNDIKRIQRDAAKNPPAEDPSTQNLPYEAITWGVDTGDKDVINLMDLIMEGIDNPESLMERMSTGTGSIGSEGVKLGKLYSSRAIAGQDSIDTQSSESQNQYNTTKLDKINRLLKKLGISEETISVTTDETTGKTSLYISPDTVEKLYKLELINQSKEKALRVRQADNNKRVLESINGRIVGTKGGGTTGVTDIHGRTASKPALPAGTQIVFTPEGDYVAVQEDGTIKKLDVSVALPLMGKNIKVGNRYLSPREAQQEYKKIYKVLNQPASSLLNMSYEEINQALNTLTSISAQLISLVPGDSNQYPKVQTTTNSKVGEPSGEENKEEE